MPVIKSAKKALRQSKRNRLSNDERRRDFREAIRSFSSNPSQKLLNVTFSSLDRAVDNKVIHINRASRLKANLQKVFSPSTKA